MQLYVVQARCQPVLTIQPQHGLANRMRAFLSACSVAKGTGRHLHVVWDRDVHINASFADLFKPSPAFSVLQIPRPVSPKFYLQYNYMVPEEGAVKVPSPPSRCRVHGRRGAVQ